jgi:hypothetical protein
VVYGYVGGGNDPVGESKPVLGGLPKPPQKSVSDQFTAPQTTAPDMFSNVQFAGQPQPPPMESSVPLNFSTTQTPQSKPNPITSFS